MDIIGAITTYERKAGYRAILDEERRLARVACVGAELKTGRLDRIVDVLAGEAKILLIAAAIRSYHKETAALTEDECGILVQHLQNVPPIFSVQELGHPLANAARRKVVNARVAFYQQLLTRDAQSYDEVVLQQCTNAAAYHALMRPVLDAERAYAQSLEMCNRRLYASLTRSMSTAREAAGTQIFPGERHSRAQEATPPHGILRSELPALRTA